MFARKISYLLLIFAIVLACPACSKRYQDLPAFSAFPFNDVENQSVGRFKTSYLADQIHAYFRGSIGGPIVVTTFVDLDNLYSTSTFGRLLGEQMISELSMRGYNVVELRQAEAIQIMHDKGELALSRDTANLKPAQDVAAIVVGTYTASPDRIYINCRVLEPATSLIASVGSVELSRTEEISKFLRNNTSPKTLERIPVRHLGYGRSPALHYYPSGTGPVWAPAPDRFAVEPGEAEAQVIKPEIPALPKAELPTVETKQDPKTAAAESGNKILENKN